MGRIHGFDGKTIDRVEFDGLLDSTTIYFTDGTEATFNSENDYWYGNKEQDEQREEQFKKELADVKPLTQKELKQREVSFEKGMQEYAYKMRETLEAPSALAQLLNK